jgi:hypothetical protein
VLLLSGTAQAGGKKNMGKQCRSHGQCKSGFCIVDSAGTARCMPRQDGKRSEPCIADSQCASGLVCNRGTCGSKPPALCGDGQREGAEECDDGSGNSDLGKDACRTDCTRASCGDGVVDSGEQCDAGYDNSDRIPNACRRSCKRASCGDGVLDEGEECDDGSDDCNQCRRCVVPRDGLTVRSDARLCPGTHRVEDRGSAGVITVQGQGTVLDCRGATLEAKQPSLAATRVAARVPGRPGGKGRANTPTRPAPRAPAGPVARRGTGIVVKGEDVTLLGCSVHGYGVGIDLKRARGVSVVRADLCQNSSAVRSDAGKNHGAANRCDGAPGWQEDGKAGCATRCAR